MRTEHMHTVCQIDLYLYAKYLYTHSAKRS